MTYLNPTLPALILLLLFGIVRRSSAAKITAGISAVGLFLWMWPPVSWLSLAGLERPYRMDAQPPDDAQAIVVLSSSTFQARPSLPEDLPGLETYVRCRYAAWLYRHWRPVPIVVTGGPAPYAVAAEVMRHVLVGEGVPAGMIRTETRSHSTYENAAYTAAMLLPQGMRRIVLVTEAYHMRRAERCFRKQGFAVAPAACAFRTPSRAEWADLLPGWSAIRDNDEALHEWIGLAWYTASGKI